jgi:hypothetical protein
MTRFIVFIFVFFQSYPHLWGQDWELKIGNKSTFECTASHSAVEWNHHYLFVYYQNLNSYNIAIVNKNAELVKTINIKSKDNANINMYGINVVDGKLLVCGSLGSAYSLEEGCYFELDSCFNVNNYTKVLPAIPSDSFSRVYGFVKYTPINKTMFYYIKRPSVSNGLGFVELENKVQQNTFFINADFLRDYYFYNDRFYFCGGDYVVVPFVKNRVSLKACWGSVNKDLSDLRYNYYKYRDSLSFSDALCMSNFTDEEEAAVSIWDRSFNISTNPDVYGLGTLTRVNSHTNEIEKELRFFTDTTIAEIPTLQLISTDNKIYTFSSQGDFPFYKTFGYIHNRNLNRLERKSISNYGLGNVFGFWDSDSNIVVYTYYKDGGNYSVIMMKYDQNLNPIKNLGLQPKMDLCKTIPNSIILENYDSLILNFDTSKFIRTPTNLNPISKKIFDFSIYPNPSNGKFKVSISHGTDYLIDVYDLYGRLLVQNLKVNDSNTEIDLQSYPASIYTIIIKNMNGEVVYTQKIIKE